jgi:hypothetical protein
MNSQLFRNVARVSRVLMGGAALAIVAAMAPGAAFAQGKSNVTGCTNFSSFSYDSTTNTLTVNGCTTGGVITPPPPPVSGPASYTLALGAVSANAGTSVNVTLQRTGGTPAEQVDLNASASGLSGWSFNGVGNNFWHTISFAAGETSKSLTFNAGGSAGTLSLMLGGVIGSSGSVTTPGTQVITVTGVSSIPGCSTQANYNNSFLTVGQKFVYSLKAGETGSTAVTPRAGTMPEVSTSDTVNTPPGADHEIVVSKCPGDFNNPVNGQASCRLKSLYKGGVVRTTATNFPDYYCQVTPGETYYMNVRQVRYDNTAANSCDFASCEVKVQIQGY